MGENGGTRGVSGRKGPPAWGQLEITDGDWKTFPGGTDEYRSAALAVIATVASSILAGSKPATLRLQTLTGERKSNYGY